MRISNTTNGLKVQAIAGNYVVMLGIDLSKQKCNGLLGFSIHRSDGDKDAFYLKAMKAFTETDPGFPSGSLYSTEHHPIQSFQWADYSAKPGATYTYTITALKGEPDNLTNYAETKVVVTTESTASDKHEVYFNRGIAASQEYVRRFGNLAPDKVPNNKAFEWLSRGLYEALESFIRSCVPGVHKLRIAAYEFHCEELLELIKSTIDTGVDIKIIYDYRQDKGPKHKNREIVDKYGLEDHCIERSEGKSYISHNKFIVKLEGDSPVSVWTGGTNFSKSGIYGHSNVAHVFKDTYVANEFFEYWKILSQNVSRTKTRDEVGVINTLPVTPLSNGMKCVFSPRPNDSNSLALYEELSLAATNGLFMTFAFGINDLFKKVFENSNGDLRFALLDKKTRGMKAADRVIEEKKIDLLRFKPENIFAIGDLIHVTNKFDGWVKERLTGLNGHVRYIHNKFMLIDPLSSDPIIVTGSANFSDASTFKNDENMVIIKGNTQIADIYLGEYMRLFSHHSFRESLKWRKPTDPPKPLKDNNADEKWWEDYFGNTPRSSKREYFSRIH